MAGPGKHDACRSPFPAFRLRCSSPRPIPLHATRPKVTIPIPTCIISISHTNDPVKRAACLISCDNARVVTEIASAGSRWTFYYLSLSLSATTYPRMSRFGTAGIGWWITCFTAHENASCSSQRRNRFPFLVDLKLFNIRKI